MWREYQFRDVCDGIFDGPHATPRKIQAGPVFLGISCLAKGRLDLDGAEHLSEADLLRWTTRITPRADDLVFSYETRLGEAALIPHGIRCCLGRRMALARPNVRLVLPRFLLYWYLSPEFQDFLRARTIPGSTVDRILLTEFPDFPVRAPGLPEQQSIVDVLGSLDDKIDLNRRMNQTLEEMASALFRSWFVDFDPVVAKAAGRVPFGTDAATAALFPSSFEDSAIGPIPRGWEVKSLGDAAYHHRDTINPLKHATETFLHFSIPAFDEGMTPVRELGVEIKSNKGVVPNGSVLISKLNPHIPRVWLVDDAETDVRRIASTEFLVFTPIPGRTRDFLFGLFGSDDFLDEFKGYVTGTSNSHQRVQATAVAGLPVLVPSKAVEQAYAATVGSLHALTLANLRESRMLADLRDILLPELLSGEIRLKDAERDVERAL